MYRISLIATTFLKLQNFSHMLSLRRRCTEGMTEPFWLKIKVTLKGQVYKSAFRARSIFPTFLKDFQKPEMLAH